MTRTIAMAALMLISGSVSATPEEQLAYCKGFVVGGLSSDQAAYTQRTDLWLAWSYLIRSGAADHSADLAGYDNGRAQFPAGLDAASVTQLLKDAQGECGLNRSGRQISGW